MGLFLTEGGNQWRVDAGDIEGTDANGTLNEVRAWDCFFGDTETMTDTNDGRQDNAAGFGLLNCKGCDDSDTLTRCRMVFRD